MKMTQIETAIRVVLEFNEAFNRHDVPGIMQLMSDDCSFENTSPAPDGTTYSGKEAVTQFWQVFFDQSPQAHIEIEEIFGFRSQCVMRWRYNWVDGSGQQGHVRGVDVFHIKNGLICEKLSYVKGCVYFAPLTNWGNGCKMVAVCNHFLLERYHEQPDHQKYPR